MFTYHKDKKPVFYYINGSCYTEDNKMHRKFIKQNVEGRKHYEKILGGSVERGDGGSMAACGGGGKAEETEPAAEQAGGGYRRRAGRSGTAAVEIWLLSFPRPGRRRNP